MELTREELNIDGEGDGEEMEREHIPLKERRLYRTHFPGAVRQRAYIFDGEGNYYNKEWDLVEGRDKEFCWYHVELPKGNQRLSQSAQYLIDVLCPPLKLQDILSLVSNGPFCGHVDGALVFRVNSPGPASGKFTFRIAARVTENSVITVSLGRVPRLGFSPMGQSLLSEVPSVESPNHVRGEQKEKDGIVIREHVLEFLLTMNHSEEADNPVPKSVSNLVVHIIDTHVDHVQDIVTKLEIELDAVEFELDRGGFTLKKQMLDDRRFPKMHLDLQRLLQVIAHGEQVFPRVKEKCASKNWFANEDVSSLEELIGRLRRLKENVGFIANRVTAIQAGLDSWQAEQINRKLYYLSFLSIIFLPLSIITGVFGMNVGGVPWTGQRDPKLKNGFRNVMLLCVAMLFVVLLCFIVPAFYTRITAWQRKRALRRNWSLNRKSFLRRTLGGEERGGYLRL
ncbi:magnesium transporter CorA-like family protein [Actinidia rufa]|uniref:Magnesium transporter CorA-like family protein n=1 Tax=Actinidia rufa TaxID=165716 RepID=A0A7J0EU18_9ERIC|nr:magnesium transporter CorA-like family protein [Actinidia rufa]